ncbi:LuxR C-terminal-related transcriptional regulator [Flavobacterium oncorhynchi]|uniref:LuxR C-terminal-related transcriptional regulator n=1 Tax=Flavobacterium oncorhynchi TaxID=728056 RepID=UPI00351A5FA4
MTNIHIPSGLIDENIELFSVDGKIMATHDGHVKKLFNLPTEFLQKLKFEMYQTPSITKALTLAGYKTEKTQLEKFAECKFGGFDLTADYKDGTFSESEYHECGYRGVCPMEGIVCGFFKVNGEIITPFEIQIIKLLATEDTLPVIAEKLQVSMNNFENKKQSLFQKMSVLSRTKLVAKCYDLQILSLKLCS